MHGTPNVLSRSLQLENVKLYHSTAKEIAYELESKLQYCDAKDVLNDESALPSRNALLFRIKSCSQPSGVTISLFCDPSNLCQLLWLQDRLFSCSLDYRLTLKAQITTLRPS